MSATAQTQIPTRGSKVRVDLFNTAVTSNVNILPAGLAPYHKPLGYFSIYGVFQGAGLLSVIRSKVVSGSVVNVTESLNNAANLAVNGSVNPFIVPVSAGETINLQYSITSTASKLLVAELLDVEP